MFPYMLGLGKIMSKTDTSIVTNLRLKIYFRNIRTKHNNGIKTSVFFLDFQEIRMFVTTLLLALEIKKMALSNTNPDETSPVCP